MPSPSNAQYLQIDATIIFYFFLIILTKFGHFFPRKFPIRNVDILSRDVDVVEQIFSHVVVIAFFIILGDRIVLIKIESNNILEWQLTIFVKLDELLIDL